MLWTIKKCLSEQIKKNRETLFDKLDSFGIKYTSKEKLFKT